MNFNLEKHLQNDYKFNDKRIAKQVASFNNHPDLKKEYIDVVLNGWSDHITFIEGYSAKILHEKYHLSLLGAYNYLITLREHPKEALELIKRGLKIK